jgi:hypothetical protein
MICKTTPIILRTLPNGNTVCPTCYEAVFTHRMIL